MCTVDKDKLQTLGGAMKEVDASILSEGLQKPSVMSVMNRMAPAAPLDADGQSSEVTDKTESSRKKGRVWNAARECANAYARSCTERAKLEAECDLLLAELTKAKQTMLPQAGSAMADALTPTVRLLSLRKDHGPPPPPPRR